MKYLVSLILASSLIAFPIANVNAEENSNIVKNNEKIKPLINFENDRCTLCGMNVNKKKFAAALVYQNKTLPFCDIGDMVIYRNKNKNKEYKAWLYDYNSEKLLDGDKSFFVITKSVRTPMRHGIIAFENMDDANSFIKSKDGELFKDFSSLSEYFISNNKISSNDDHYHHHGHHLGFRGQPIGIMGAHTHHQGSLMASYGFMYMNMDKMLSGTNTVSKETILKDFTIAPERMDMFMNMLGVMYSVTDNLTIMGMLPFNSKFMTGSMAMSMDNHSTMNTMAMDDHSTSSSMSSQGLGDLRLDAVYSVYQDELHSIILSLGTSLPTGNINTKGDMHGMSNQQYPYPMQMGSGTFDLLAGITYTSGLSDWTWGGQVNGDFRLVNNSNNYKLGNKYNFTAWGGRRILSWLHSFIRVNLDTWDNISGKDTSMHDNMTPSARADLRAGTKLDLFAGLNFVLPDLFGKNNLGIEAGLPVYQNLTGPQMANTWYLNTGIQHLF